VQGAAAVATGCVGEVVARRERKCGTTKFERPVQKHKKGNRRFLNPHILVS
jgi:hypothetical protein